MGRIHLGSILGTTITLDVSFLILCALFVMMNLDTSGVQYALLWVPVLFRPTTQSMPSRRISSRTRPQRRSRSSIENVGSCQSVNTGSRIGSSVVATAFPSAWDLS